DLFSVQDEITQKVSASIQSEIRIHEGAFLNSTLSNRSAAGFVKLAWTALYKLTATGFREARSHIESARAIAGDDPKVDQIAAVVEFHEFYLGHSSNRSQLDRGLAFAERAVSANPSDEYSHWILGLLSTCVGQHDRGIGALRRAIELNPNFAL